MEAKHVKDIIEAYASVYQSKESLLESNVDFGYKGGIPGIYDKNGNLVKKASELDPQQLKDLEADYIRRRGPAQIDIDKQVQQLKKQEQDKARAAAAADTAAQQQQQAPAAADTAAQQQQQAPPKPTKPAFTAQTGDKAKDMATWAKANPRLAEVERLRAQQKSAGKSVFDKEFRTNVVNPVMYNSGGRSVEDSKKKFPASSTPAPKPVSLSVVPYKEPEEKKQLVKDSYEYDAYDLVLEYLLSQGHTDTVEEAQYVMMEMDAEMIGTIVEGMGLSVGISKLVGKLGANPRTSAEEGAKNFQKNVTDPIGFGVKDAIRAVVQPADNSPEAQKARKDKYRP